MKKRKREKKEEEKCMLAFSRCNPTNAQNGLYSDQYLGSVCLGNMFLHLG